jgi:transcriptional regulator with XRE-family HTH domain
VSSAHSPTVRRRRLALELRRLREAARLTCEEVADRMECSASKISRVETGRVSVSPRDVRDMLEIYGAPEDQRDSLVQLARESRQKGWWHAYADSVQPHYATYLGLESAASEIRIFRVNHIPGLLQTEDYAHALIGLTAGNSHAEDHRRFAILTERQRQSRTTAPRVWAVLDEAALWRQVGGPEVMRAQIEHLRDLGSEPNFFLQVVPFRGEAQACMDSPFTILGFPDRGDPNVVCLRYPTGVLWVEDLAEVDRYHTFFYHLQAAALSFDDTVNLMTSVLKDL